MIFNFNFRGKRFKIKSRKSSLFGKYVGLMCKSSETENLLFEFKKDVNLSIHSFFVFFRFLAIWLDEKNEVVDFKIVKPFCFSVRPKNKFRRLIEIPFNKENKKIITYFSKKG